MNIIETPEPLRAAQNNAHLFTPEFLAYLPENLHVYRDFEREALRVVRRGLKHYAARTIMEVLRHNSALAEAGEDYKLNNNMIPSHARLFALMHPIHAGLFEFRGRRGPQQQEGADA
jgi:hypothetical protein